MTRKNNLLFDDELRINEVFNANGWQIDNTNKSSLYNRYRKRCQELKQEERDLFYKLSLEFKWVSLDEYTQFLVELLKKIVLKYSVTSQHMYIIPLKKESDCNKIKSADVVSYLCKSTQLKHIDALSKKSFKIITTFSDIPKKIIDGDKRLIIIDDFIGSGKYSCEVVDELVKRGVLKSNIIVSTFFISENGLNRLETEGYHVEYVEIVKNALKDLTNKEKSVLKKIEATLNVNNEYSFGYEKSANLISLIRTPNNTLPIFWYKNSSREQTAPFERRREQ